MADELFDIVGEEPPAVDSGTEESSSPPAQRSAIVVRLHVQPGAGRSAVIGRHGDALHVRVAPPPQDNRANIAVTALVAELFDVAKGSVELVSGEHSREKRVRVQDVDLDVVRQRIAEALVEAKPRGQGRGESSGKVRQPH